jgi:diketogulonate reductase-like aldo/keto reductase
MKYETIHGLQIPKIGFGCWGIGGGTRAEPRKDEKSLRALRSALELGYTHFDTAEMYAAGHSEELLGQAIRESGIERERLFITSKVTPANLHDKDVLRACERSLRRLGMETLDLYLIHWPSESIPLEESFRALNRLVKEGKVRHIGVSNFDLAQLREAVSLSETPLLTNQVPYSLAQREYVKNGVLAYCQEHEVLLTAYSPVEEGRLRPNAALKEIAAGHGATPYQVALAWLVAQPRVIAIPASFDPGHQAENLAAAEIALSDEEMQQLTGLA